MSSSFEKIPRWFFVDLAFVLLFVALGRSAHHHAYSIGGMISTTWPFAIGLGVGWLFVTFDHRSGTSLKDGSLIVVVMVSLGMLLRVLSGQGTALAFIFVALAFLGLMLLGSRLLFRGLRR